MSRRAEVDLRVSLGPLELKNPVLTASGTFGYGQEFSQLFDLNRLGGIVARDFLSIREQEAPPGSLKPLAAC